MHWDETQNITSALKYSVNWYYLDLIHKMNMDKTKEVFNSINFGIVPDILYPHFFFFSSEVYTNAYK